jgi:four helix bundle protein
MVQSYRDLKVWQKAMALVKSVYALCDTLPKDQKYTLVSQLQRAVISVPANIAEGRSRHTAKEFTYFLNIARGSLAEVETYLLLISDLEYAQNQAIEAMLQSSNEITKMLFGLRDSLETVPQNLKPETCNLRAALCQN